MTVELIDCDRKTLLSEAYQRVVSKREVTCAIEQRGSAQAEIAQCLGAAFRCVESLSKPAGAILEVGAEVVDEGVLLARGPVIHNTRMRDRLTGRAKVYLYLVTCGYDSRDAFRWLENDYFIYHFQDMIGRELLYGAGRLLHRVVCASSPNYRFARYAVKMQDRSSREGASEATSLPPVHWDAGKVRSLLHLFGSQTLGVSTNDSGFFLPMHSLLGVMMGIPDIAGHKQTASSPLNGADRASNAQRLIHVNHRDKFIDNACACILR